MFYKIASRFFGDALVVPLSLLTGNSLSRLFQRILRIRQIAASMMHGGLRPPMPVRLQVETTDLCNLKCRMCTREILTDMNTRDMSLNKFKALVSEIDPYYVTLNGLGEPLIDKTIFDKLTFLHERGTMTSMPTNGTYIRRNKLDELARNLPNILQLSIDGATKESFEYIRVDADFDTIISNYRRIVDRKNRGQVRSGTKIRILCALQKRNLFDYRGMYDLLKSMPGIDSFELVPVFDYDADGSAFSHLIPSEEEVVKLHCELDEAIAAADSAAERDFYDRWKSTSAKWLTNFPESRGYQTVNTHACLIPWFNAYVDAKGRVYPCCYLTNSVHEMGNTNAKSFGEIWHGEKYQAFRKNLMMDRPNLHGCRSCPRNDDKRLNQIGKLRMVLGRVGKEAL